MRKFGMIAMALGAVLVVIDLALRSLAGTSSWTWALGALFLLAGAAAWKMSSQAAQPVLRAPPPPAPPPGLETTHLLENFEQRFAELKKRAPSATVLGDLHAMASKLEQHGRIAQATAVFRHLVRLDAGFRDADARLKRLIDRQGTASHRATPTKAQAPASPSPGPVAKPAPVETPGAVAEGMHGEIRSLGRYRLEREIGRGAMGTVYLGRDSAINRLVAIKAIPLAREFSDAELVEARSRFFREAETAGRLNHPGIVTIYDVGEQDGLAYIAMEYLKGRHLSDFASPATLLEPRKVLDLMARTADALGFAHRQNVVHRDIKPANLMFDPAADALKITDFGIARLTDSGCTRTGIVLGTPSFMSPEQLEGRAVSGASDLFSLGVSLFQLLTAQLPFRADTMTGLMQQIAEMPHPSIRAIRPDLPDCVQQVIDRALAKRPEDRFESGMQMAAALQDCVQRIPGGVS